MSESATGREAKRRETEHRISTCAQILADEHGLDGFTIDELAEAAGVSRRTVFNYFPSKLEAVVGPRHELPEEIIEEFRRGGPTGRLVEDVFQVAKALIRTKDLSRADVERHTRLLGCTPRLMSATHQRFTSMTAEFSDIIREREGEDFDPARARFLVRLVVAIFDSAMQDFVEDPDERPLDHHFEATLRIAQELGS